MNYLILILFLLGSQANAGEEEGVGTKIGIGKGVVFYAKEAGFQLSPEAVKRMGIISKLISKTSCKLSSFQVVSALDKRFIYILRDQKYKSIPIDCAKVHPNDEGVVSGSEFLQVVELDLNSNVTDEKEASHD